MPSFEGLSAWKREHVYIEGAGVRLMGSIWLGNNTHILRGKVNLIQRSSLEPGNSKFTITANPSSTTSTALAVERLSQIHGPFV